MNSEPKNIDVFGEGREIETQQEEAEQKDIAFDLTPYYFNMDIASLIRRLSEDGSILIPSFQRNYVWDRVGASLFIDSILRGLPSPSLFFFEEERQKYLVIDGQQRILTLFYFIKGIFPREKKHQSVTVSTKTKTTNLDHVKNMFSADRKIEGEPFKLGGKVHPDWKGKTFQELSEKEQNYLLNTYIYIVNLRQTKPVNDNASMFLIFERINTGAKSLNAQQIRLCVGHGALANLINEYVDHPVWKYFNLNDDEGNVSELILRFLALYYTKEPFKGSMRRFLDSFLQDNRNFESAVKENEVKNLCESSLTLIHEAFKAEDFYPSGKFSGYMFLPIWIGIANASKNQHTSESLKTAFRKIKNNQSFKEFYTDTRRAASAKNLYPIIELAKEVFSN